MTLPRVHGRRSPQTARAVLDCWIGVPATAGSQFVNILAGAPNVNPPPIDPAVRCNGVSATPFEDRTPCLRPCPASQKRYDSGRSARSQAGAKLSIVAHGK